MSKLEMSIPHQLSQQEAVTRIQQLLKKLADEQKDVVSNVKEEWNGNNGQFAFNAKGFDLSGKIQVNPSSVDINADLPFMVSLFSGKIKSIITEKATELLA